MRLGSHPLINGLMKKGILVMIFLAPALASFSQDLRYFFEDESEYKHAFTFEPLNLLLKTISVSYIVQMNNKSEFRINPKISFPFKNVDNTLLEPVEDPFWYYSSYGLQFGFSKMLGQHAYIEPMFFGRYATFHDRELQTKDPDGDRYDEFETVDRKYVGSGFILRSGVKRDNGNFRFNFFYGVGFNVRAYEEDVKSRRTASGTVNNVYDPEPNYWKAKLTVQVGFEIGPRF